VAAVIKEALGVDTELQEGARGEFSVWVGEKRVAQKGPEGFPTEEKRQRRHQAMALTL
jgi:hypothetical protein